MTFAEVFTAMDAITNRKGREIKRQLELASNSVCLGVAMAFGEKVDFGAMGEPEEKTEVKSQLSKPSEEMVKKYQEMAQETFRNKGLKEYGRRND